MAESTQEPLEEGYFYCPECGEKDYEFFDEVLIQKVSKKQYEKLTEEQKLYINEKYEYGVYLCEHCYDKAKKRSWIVRGTYIVMIILLFTLPVAALCLFPILIFIVYYQDTQKIDFNHAWECGAVRRLRD